MTAGQSKRYPRVQSAAPRAQHREAVAASEKYSAASVLLKPLGREDAQHVGNVDSKAHLKRYLTGLGVGFLNSQNSVK